MFVSNRCNILFFTNIIRNNNTFFFLLHSLSLPWPRQQYTHTRINDWNNSLIPTQTHRHWRKQLHFLSKFNKHFCIVGNSFHKSHTPLHFYTQPSPTQTKTNFIHIVMCQTSKLRPQCRKLREKERKKQKKMYFCPQCGDIKVTYNIF